MEKRLLMFDIVLQNMYDMLSIYITQDVVGIVDEYLNLGYYVTLGRHENIKYIDGFYDCGYFHTIRKVYNGYVYEKIDFDIGIIIEIMHIKLEDYVYGFGRNNEYILILTDKCIYVYINITNNSQLTLISKIPLSSSPMIMCSMYEDGIFSVDDKYYKCTGLKIISIDEYKQIYRFENGELFEYSSVLYGEFNKCVTYGIVRRCGTRLVIIKPHIIDCFKFTKVNYIKKNKFNKITSIKSFYNCGYLEENKLIMINGKHMFLFDILKQKLTFLQTLNVKKKINGVACRNNELVLHCRNRLLIYSFYTITGVHNISSACSKELISIGRRFCFVTNKGIACFDGKLVEHINKCGMIYTNSSNVYIDGIKNIMLSEYVENPHYVTYNDKYIAIFGKKEIVIVEMNIFVN